MKQHNRQTNARNFVFIKNGSPSFFIKNPILTFVFAVSSILILTLSIVNNGSANDDHIEVIELIFNQNKIPEPKDCWQCYHPKFYHFTVAKLDQLLKIDTRKSRIKVTQIVNALAGILTLFICLIFIRNQPFSIPVKLLSFSMIAFNPRFIAIHGQASNDAFAILFGTIILYALFKYVKKPTLKLFLLLLTATCLVGVTKGNSFILIIGVVAVLILKIISSRKISPLIVKKYFGSLLFFLITTIFVVGYFGEYYGNYMKYGKPVVYNTPTVDLSDSWKEMTFRRPGVQSIVGGYFTFRFFDLIKTPKITNGHELYPLHRTSVWSQLYGRAHFLYFDNWPEGAWQSADPKIMNIGRGSLALAIFPTILFLLGLLKNAKIWGDLFFRRKIDFLNNRQDWIFPIFILGFLIFIILFTLVGRDFSFMKIIYLFPAIFATLIPLLKGFEVAHNYLAKKKFLLIIFYTMMITLLILYVIPVLDLISKLV